MTRPVLIDSCIWIDFFNKNSHRSLLQWISDNMEPVVNFVVLAEVVPGLMHAREKKAADSLMAQRRLEMKIDWRDLIRMQLFFLKKGVNKIGLMDLVIVQNSLQNQAVIATADKKMKKMCGLLNITVLEKPGL